MDYKIRRALVSVSDKTKIIELCQALKRYGVEIIATGGTGELLKKEGLSFTPIEDFTGNPEAFDGRMKTISFKLESALLFDRTNGKHLEQAEHLGVPPIDLVVCNFYPFEKTLKQNPSWDVLVENIDVGGPTMVRAAAKNHKSVTVLVDPVDYATFLQELDAKQGSVTLGYRKTLMVKAFEMLSLYDSLIFEALLENSGFTDAGTALRYGENPQQKAVMRKFREAGAIQWESLDGAGIPLSYNNILDAEAAFGAVRDLNRVFENECSVVIVKHQNPCGIAVESSSLQALKNAWAGDSTSSFGGIIAMNKTFTKECAQFLEGRFIEVLLAPDFEPGVLESLKEKKKNLRVLKIKSFTEKKPPVWVRVEGGFLLQEADDSLNEELFPATQKKFTEQQLATSRFGVVCTKWIKSNAISLVRQTTTKGYQLVGMGSGQPNRVDAIRRLAVPKAKKALEEMGENFEDVKGSLLLVSDAFFPFSDSIEEAFGLGVTHVVQPGGSKRDDEVVAACNKLGVAMVMTKTRHFRH